MKTEILDGKLVGEGVLQRANHLLTKKYPRVRPGLAVIMVGGTEDAKKYLEHIQRTAEPLGIRVESHWFPEDVNPAEVIGAIEELNYQSGIHGILIQCPLPQRFNSAAFTRAIDPGKDVDGFHPDNRDLRTKDFPPAFPGAIMEILLHCGGIEGQTARVVSGEHSPFGKIMQRLLWLQGAAEVVCITPDQVKEGCFLDADIIILACRFPEILRGEHLRTGVTVIDAGFVVTEDGRAVGNAHRPTVEGVAGKLTPVPGGVGPVTVAMILFSTIRLAMQQRGSQ